MYSCFSVNIENPTVDELFLLPGIYPRAVTRAVTSTYTHSAQKEETKCPTTRVRLVKILHSHQKARCQRSVNGTERTTPHINGKRRLQNSMIPTS